MYIISINKEFNFDNKRTDVQILDAPYITERQAIAEAQGDEEAMPMDYDYIEAMEYGMPPISGWGMGIDRLIQLLTNQENIKDVIMFPLMRPKD